MTKCRYNNGWRIESHFGKDEKQISFQAKRAEKKQIMIVPQSIKDEIKLAESNPLSINDSSNSDHFIIERMKTQENNIDSRLEKYKKINEFKNNNSSISNENDLSEIKNNLSEGTNTKENYIGDFIGSLIDGLLIVALVILAIAVIFLIFMLVQVALVDWVLALILLFLIILDLLFFNGELTFSLLSCL